MPCPIGGVDEMMHEASSTSETEIVQLEWALNAQSSQHRLAEETRARRERTERILRRSRTDVNALLDAIVAATVAASGREMTEHDGASAKALFAWALCAHAQISKRASVRATALTRTRRGATLSAQMVRDLWAASANINLLLDTVDADD